MPKPLAFIVGIPVIIWVAVLVIFIVRQNNLPETTPAPTATLELTPSEIATPTATVTPTPFITQIPQKTTPKPAPTLQPPPSSGQDITFFSVARQFQVMKGVYFTGSVRVLNDNTPSGTIRWPYTWSVVSGQLPPGVSLYGTAYPGIQADIQGVPTATGVYKATIKATNPIGRSGTYDITITSLDQSPQITIDTPKDGDVLTHDTSVPVRWHVEYPSSLDMYVGGLDIDQENGNEISGNLIDGYTSRLAPNGSMDWQIDDVWIDKGRLILKIYLYSGTYPNRILIDYATTNGTFTVN